MKTKFFFFVIVAVIAVLPAVQAQSTTNRLDGKKYKIELKKDGTTESVETLIFTSDKLQTPDCNKYGFTEAKAYVKQTEGYISWSSTISSEKEGVMAWQGTVKGDKIEGNCTWRKTGQDAIHYTFSGTELKAAK